MEVTPLLTILKDPMVFSYVTMALYAMNAIQFLFRGMYADCFYWLSALSITATVTFGYQR